MKRGSHFVTTVASAEVQMGIWDPYAYRSVGRTATLGQHVEAEGLRRDKRVDSPFDPISYRDVTATPHLTFQLRLRAADDGQTRPYIGEEQLLFGTMRAYLGNVLLTPRAEWVGYPSPVFFHVNSEFLCIRPQDGLSHFWLAYLRSSDFLRHLPLGTGGTRPRLHAEALLSTPVCLPNEAARHEIDEALAALARAEWTSYMERLAFLKSVDL